MDESKRFRDVCRGISKLFPKLSDFKGFAGSCNGLCLHAHDVLGISEDNPSDGEEQRIQILLLWRERSGKDGAERRLKDLAIQYCEAEKPPQGTENLEHVFLDIVENFSSQDLNFNTFAQSVHGLSLSYHEVESCIANYSCSEECNYQQLWAWRLNHPKDTDAAIVRSIRKLADQYIDNQLKGEEFCRIAENHTNDKINNLLDPIKKKIGVDDFFLPVIAKVKLDDQASSGKPEKHASSIPGGVFHVGTDLEAVHIEDLHKEKSVNHVMLLGDTGCGKTTLAHYYARLAIQRKLDSLKNIKMVYIVDVSKLNADSKSTAFDLLFVQQLGSRLPVRLRRSAEKWFDKNAADILLIIEGFDQAGETSENIKSKIAIDTKAKPNVVLANIMSNHICREMKILTTCRWHVYWKLNSDQRPKITFAARGFDAQTLDILIGKLFDESKLESVYNFQLNVPGLLSSPLFLFYLAKVLKKSQDDIPDTISNLMVSLLRHFSVSRHRGGDSIVLENKLMKLAFHGMQENLFSFSANFVTSLELDMKDMEGLVNKNVDDRFLDYVDIAREDDLQVKFPHLSIQEILAALYICKQDIDEFKKIVDDCFDKPGFYNVLNYVFGVLIDSSTTEKAEYYLESSQTSLNEKRDFLSKYLDEKPIKGQVISDGRIALLLQECGLNITEKISKIKRVSLEKKGLTPEENWALMKIAKHFSGLDSFEVLSLIVQRSNYSSLINIMKKAKEVSIGRLSLYNCELTTTKLEDLVDGIKNIKQKNGKVEVNILSVDSDKSMKPDEYKEVVEMVPYARIKYLGFKDCDLNAAKLKYCIEGGSNISGLASFRLDRNGNMKEETFEQIPAFLKKTKTRMLFAHNCPSSTDFSSLFSCLAKENIPLSVLGVGRILTEVVSDDEFEQICTLVQNSVCCFHYEGRTLNESQQENFQGNETMKVLCFSLPNEFILVNLQHEFIAMDVENIAKDFNFFLSNNVIHEESLARIKHIIANMEKNQKEAYVKALRNSPLYPVLKRNGTLDKLMNILGLNLSFANFFRR